MSVTGWAAGALLVLTACSVSVHAGNKQLNIDQGEQVIQEQLAAKTGVPIDRVDCPERTVKKGDQFDCTAFVQGQTLQITVTQTDDKGTITGQPKQALLDMNKAIAAFQPSIQQQTGVAVQVTCGDVRYRVQAVGSTFDCQLTVPGGTTRRIEVTVKDVDGGVDYHVV